MAAPGAPGDTAALLEQALTGRSTLFPLTLGGIWRERLAQQLERLLNTGLSMANTNHGDEAVERYRDALHAIAPSSLRVALYFTRIGHLHRLHDLDLAE